MPDQGVGHETLNSWKEIAAFLAVSVRTAQRYERELRLPIHRPAGEKGRVLAYANDLSAWRKTAAIPKWWQDSRFLLRYAIGATAVALVLGALVLRELITRASRGQPYTSQWLGSTLVVYDKEANELWRKTFERQPDYPYSIQRQHIDLDGDGRVETLIPYVTPMRESEGGALYCFSSKGKDLWRIQPNRSVSDRKTRYTTLYVLRSFRVFPSPKRDGSHWIAAAFVHHYAFPSVTVVLDANGKKKGEYWHSGHLQAVHTLDLDGDGKEEIILAGTSLAFSKAVLRVFAAEKVAGAEVLPPGHPNQLLGFEPGAEKATVFFERSRLNRSIFSFNYAYWIGPNSISTDRSFNVNVNEGLGDYGGYLIYTLRSNLNLLSVQPSESLRMVYRDHILKDPKFEPFSEKDLVEVRHGFRVVRGPSSSYHQPQETARH